MPLAARMKTSGLSEGQAKAINGNVAMTVTAAGTNQATATKLTSGVNIVTTVSSGTGVILIATDISDTMEVTNFGANLLKLYPDSGSRLGGLSTNTPLTLGLNSTCQCRRVSPTRWTVLMSS